jgi:hypothetical protein
VPETDKLAAEWDVILGNPERDFVEKGFHQSPPWPELFVPRSRTLALTLDFPGNLGGLYLN